MRHAMKPAVALLVMALPVACGDAIAPVAPQDPLAAQFARPPQCKMNLDLVLDESGALRADTPLKHYIDKQEGVVVRSTGGLLFDTNTSRELESASDIRRARVDLSGTDHAAHGDPFDTNGIDLTFGDADPPVNLCDMADGQTVKRQATLTFVSSSNGGVVKLAFGWNRADPGPDDTCEILHGPDVRLSVVRLPGNVWEVTSTKACFYDKPWGTLLLDTDAATPFAMKFTVTPK